MDCYDQTKLHFKLPDTAEDLSNLFNLAKYTIVNCSAQHHGNLLFNFNHHTITNSTNQPYNTEGYLYLFFAFSVQ